MSNSLDSFLTRIGDVTIERVTPRPGPKPNETIMSNETVTNSNMNNVEPQTGNDESSEESSGETSDGEHDKKNDTLQSEEIEEIRSEGSGDDMDLDETIDSQIGVRAESERQHHSQAEEDDEEPVNILDTLPLEGLYNIMDFKFVIFLNSNIIVLIILKFFKRSPNRGSGSV